MYETYNLHLRRRLPLLPCLCPTIFTGVETGGSERGSSLEVKVARRVSGGINPCCVTRAPRGVYVRWHGTERSEAERRGAERSEAAAAAAPARPVVSA